MAQKRFSNIHNLNPLFTVTGVQCLIDDFAFHIVQLLKYHFEQTFREK